jgi:hypothetical protein
MDVLTMNIIALDALPVQPTRLVMQLGKLVVSLYALPENTSQLWVFAQIVQIIKLQQVINTLVFYQQHVQVENISQRLVFVQLVPISQLCHQTNTHVSLQHVRIMKKYQLKEYVRLVQLIKSLILLIKLVNNPYVRQENIFRHLEYALPVVRAK